MWWICLFVCICVCVCVSVCLWSYPRNHTRDLYQIFVHVVYLWPWLGSSPASLRYVTYFRFCGWYHVFVYNEPYEFRYEGPISLKLVCAMQLTVANCRRSPPPSMWIHGSGLPANHQVTCEIFANPIIKFWGSGYWLPPIVVVLCLSRVEKYVVRYVPRIPSLAKNSWLRCNWLAQCARRLGPAKQGNIVIVELHLPPRHGSVITQATSAADADKRRSPATIRSVVRLAQ